MRSILTICLFSIGLLVYGQDVETRDVKKFYDISVQGPFKVELSQGKTGQLEISSEKIPMDEIITDVSGNELNIKLKTRAYLKDDYYDMDYIKVKVYYDELEEIDVSMGSIVKVKDVIKQEYLAVESTMGAEVYVEMDVEELDCKVTMGGIMELEGEADYADITASMGGEFEGHFLTARKADIRSGMGGIVTIGADERLNGSATMGGVIRYSGNPEKKNTSTVLGGEIHKTKKKN